MNSIRRTVAVIAAGLAVFAFGDNKAADLLKGIRDYRDSLIAQSQDKANGDPSKIDFDAIDVQVKTKAADALKGVDLAKVPAAETTDWAELLILAGKGHESEAMLTAFIASKPTSESLFAANTILLEAALANKDTKTLVDTLLSMKAFDPAS